MRWSRGALFGALTVFVTVVGLAAASPMAAAEPDLVVTDAHSSTRTRHVEKPAAKRQKLTVAVTAPVGSVARLLLPPLTSVVTLTGEGTRLRAKRPVLRLDDGVVVVDVPENARKGRTELEARGTGCAGATCPVSFTLKVRLTVTALVPAPPGAGTMQVASQDRLAAAEPLPSGGVALRDELVVTIGTSEAPGPRSRADAVAALVGAVVTGGLEDIGVYQLRWPAPRDLAPVLAVLAGQPDVAASRSVYGDIGPTALPPGDWDDDTAVATWPFAQIRATSAWDITTGGQVKVGIVDGGTVFGGHEDLDVVQTLGSEGAAGHATHVAGLACGKANGKGLVGVAWGCPITTIGIDSDSDVSFLIAAHDMASAGVKVVNMSLGFPRQMGGNELCVDGTAEAQQVVDAHANWDKAFQHLFNGDKGRGIVWTIAAGNSCAPLVMSPWGQNYGLPNVITVAATNQDKALSSFSNFGDEVEVAAPGGVSSYAGGNNGIWSTWVNTCGLGDLFLCGTYKQEPGTSMAAPMVAGVAALVRSVAPDMSAADVGSCIVSTAGTRTGAVGARSADPVKTPDGSGTVTPKVAFTPGRLKIVDAEAAVKCGQGQQPGGAGILVLGGGDRTASGNGTDLGDLTADLTGAGYEVSTSQTLPADLSGFTQIWYIDTDALPADDAARLVAYGAGGGALFLTGEWGCCSVDQTTLATVNALTGGGAGTVTHGGSVGDGTVPVSATAPGGIASDPHALSTITLSAAGSLLGVPAANRVATSGGNPDAAVVAAWDHGDTVGHGRIVVVMDVNWFAQQYRAPNWSDVAENFARFLSL